MQVKKRDGTYEDFDLQKIRVILDWATAGLDVSPLKLEASITSNFKNKISTQEIQQILINTSNQLASVEEPDWVNVSGRLYIMNILKQAKISFGVSYLMPYVDYLKFMIKKGKYIDIFEWYTEEEIAKCQVYLKPDRDDNFTIAGAIALDKKYLVKIGGNFAEIPQLMYLTIALIQNRNERSFRLRKVKDTYDTLSLKEVSLATPFLSGLRVPNANLSSCFVGETGDSLESLNASFNAMTYISKAGGGIGWYFGKVRPSGSWVGDSPNAANHINLWVKIVNDIIVAVNQGGRRKGSCTIGLDFWHKDIEGFLEMGTENGDQRLKAHDIFPQLVISDWFIKALKEEKDYWAVDSYEILKHLKVDITELYGTRFDTVFNNVQELYSQGILKNGVKVSAKSLWKLALKVWIETGKLYIVHKDNINRMNPVSDMGTIKQFNLCVESTSITKPVTMEGSGLVHVCNLSSINMAEILNSQKKLEASVRLIVRLLDNALDISDVPLDQGRRHNEFLRTIGVGIIGVADWMAYNGLSYEKEEGKRALEILFEKVAYYTFDESANLAIERGSFLLYSNSSFNNGYILGVTKEEMLQRNITMPWEDLYEKIAETGIRNAHTFMVPPSTSTSVLLGCSASYLPIMSKFFYEHNADLMSPQVPKFLASNFWHYKENIFIDQVHILELTARLQKWIDTGISMEINLNPELFPSIKNFSDNLVKFFEDGGKALYYGRTHTAKETGCVSCAN